MAEPAITQRTPILGLKFESDDTRNFNWNRIDDLIARAFTPGSPIQLPPGLGGAGPVHPMIVPGVVTLAGVDSGLLFDASTLVLTPPLLYRLWLAGDVTRPGGGTATLTVTAGGVALYDHLVGGPPAATETETFALTVVLYVQADNALRIVSTGLFGPERPADLVVQAPPTLYVNTVVPTGVGLTVGVTWDSVRAPNLAHGTLALLETITSIP